jgi:G3E family GTPase
MFGAVESSEGGSCVSTAASVSALLGRVSEEPTARLRLLPRFDYLLVESTGLSEPLPVPRRRLGRRTTLTFPLFPPPQKN